MTIEKAHFHDGKGHFRKVIFSAKLIFIIKMEMGMIHEAHFHHRNGNDFRWGKLIFISMMEMPFLYRIRFHHGNGNDFWP